MKILGINIISDKKLQRIIKEAKKELFKKIMHNPSSKNTVLKSELGIMVVLIEHRLDGPETPYRDEGAQ